MAISAKALPPTGKRTHSSKWSKHIFCQEEICTFISFSFHSFSLVFVMKAALQWSGYQTSKSTRLTLAHRPFSLGEGVNSREQSSSRAAGGITSNRCRVESWRSGSLPASRLEACKEGWRHPPVPCPVAVSSKGSLPQTVICLPQCLEFYH